jgi:TIR domain
MMCPDVARFSEVAMAGKIFINYRRDDSMSAAGRLHDRLAQTFGRNNLFMDVDHIPAGVDFVDYLNSQVAACDVFLAVIGPNWLNAKDDRGRRRFENPDDFVMIEIAAALARNIRVIPVLVDGARTPKADKLPDSVKPLVRRHAVEVRNTQFGRDAEALATKIREALEGAPPVTRPRRFLASTAAWLMTPGRWRVVAGSATGLLLVGWVILYQMGWVPGTRADIEVKDPRVNGRPVDWCLVPTKQCGKDAADRYCQMHNMGPAVSFRRQQSDERTLILGTSEICDTTRFNRCDRFSVIVCSANRRRAARAISFGTQGWRTLR